MTARVRRPVGALLPLLAAVVVVAAGAAVTIHKPYTAAPAIRSDGLGYHAWSRAILTKDLGFCHWASLGPVGAISARNPVHPERCENKYSAGLALVRLPVMVFVTERHGHDLVPSRGEDDASLWLGVLTLGAMCLLIGLTLRRLGVRAWIADVTALAACFGTGAGKVLLSYERGLFTYYPALLVLLVGALVPRRSRPWAGLALACVLVLDLVYGSWYSWFLGGGFGHRGFVDVVPVIAVAGGVGLEALGRRARAGAAAALVVCSVVTLQLMAGYWKQTLPFSGTTQQQYWSHVVGDHSLLG